MENVLQQITQPLKPATTLCSVAAWCLTIGVVLTNSRMFYRTYLLVAVLTLGEATVRIGLARLKLTTGGTNDFLKTILVYFWNVSLWPFYYHATSTRHSGNKHRWKQPTFDWVCLKLYWWELITDLVLGCHTSSHMVIKLNNTVVVWPILAGGTFVTLLREFVTP
jgi:hypothetical protein